MKMMNGLLAASCLLGLVATAPASATTFVDTGVQGGSLGGLSLTSNQYLAGRFTLSAASVLTDVAGYIGSTATNTIRVSLRADNGSTPGLTVFSANFTALSNANSGAWQGVSGQNWAVGAGTYWISFENLNGGSAFMAQNAPNPLSLYAYSPNSGGTWTTGQFNFGVRVSGDVGAGAVPEPASWAMMIGGVGLVGGAMRRRQSKVTTKVSFA